MPHRYRLISVLHYSLHLSLPVVYRVLQILNDEAVYMAALFQDSRFLEPQNQQYCSLAIFSITRLELSKTEESVLIHLK